MAAKLLLKKYKGGYKLKNKVKSILLVILTFALVTTLGITSFAQTSVNAEKAAIQTDNSAQVKPIDIDILIDKSEAVEKGNFAKNSAIELSSKILQPNSNNRVAVISFNDSESFAQTTTATATDSAVDINYTNDIEAVKEAINQNATRNNLQAAVNLSKNNLLNARADAKKVILLITDGDKNLSAKNAEINAEMSLISLADVSKIVVFNSEDLIGQSILELEGGKINTEEYATRSYADSNKVDSNKVDKSGEQSKPQVNIPKNLSVSLTDVYSNLGEEVSLGSGGFDENQNLMSDITGSDGNGIFKYEWVDANKGTVVSTERIAKVNPDADTRYQLTVTDSNGNKGIAEMWVRPRGKITITKQAMGIKDEESQRQYDILVTGPSGKCFPLYLKNGESRTIKGLEPGEYNISELQPMNFVSCGAENSTSFVSVNKPGPSVTVISERNNGSWFYDEDED